MPKKSAKGAGQPVTEQVKPWGLEQVRVGSCPPNQTGCTCGTVTFELTSAGGPPTIYSWNCTGNCIAPGDSVGFSTEDLRAFAMDSFCLYIMCCVPKDSDAP